LCCAALLLTGCPRRGGGAQPEPSPTDSSKPPSVELLAQNVRLPVDGVARFGIGAAEPTARVIVTFPDTGSVVAVCGLASIDDAVPKTLPTAGCIEELASGVREQLVRTAGLGAVAIWVRSGPAVDATVRLEFAEATRRFVMRLPVLPEPRSVSACTDNACNPFFEIRPVRSGRFRATATWVGGRARIALLQGTVMAKSFTATGVPYRVPAERTGAGELSLDTLLSAPAEYALVLDRNTSTLSDVRIDASWP
jgi:hypothetical protein